MIGGGLAEVGVTDVTHAAGRCRLDVADEPFELTARAWIATGQVR